MSFQINCITGNVYSVSNVNNLIKGLLDGCPELKNIKVRGEISNYKVYSSGHHYFSIKDAGSVLNCVMFKGQATTLRFVPENGMNVIISGSISVYPRDGKYQLYCERIVPDGAGALQEAFERLKKRLSEEGLFNDSAKKPIPVYPKTIALVTSPSGAAVRDMVRILKTRWPLTKVLVVPVTVQGSTSASEIAEALSLINDKRLADLIIVGRGGGSIEDLWSFNEETVARAIYSSEIPVISAVGHEPDVTISDYVSDKRASTPSNASEIAVPDIRDVRKLLSSYSSVLDNGLTRIIERFRSRIQYLSSKEVFTCPDRRIQYLRQDLDHLRIREEHGIEDCLKRSIAAIGRLKSSVEALNPANTLLRGYSVAMLNGRVISGIRELSENPVFTLRMADGEADCSVIRIQTYEEYNEKREDDL